MVISLGPGKFYGSSLPRPRYYTDVKFNTERVDPPVPVMDPLLSWATQAHWSMGGLSFKRLRLQGRIEGNVDKLRKQQDRVSKERLSKKVDESEEWDEKVRVLSEWDDDGSESDKGVGSDESPPPAPVAGKRRKRILVESEDDEEEESISGMMKRRLARKLNDEFDQVSHESEGLGVVLGKKKGRSKGSENIGARLTRSRKLVVDQESNGESSEGVKTKKGKKSVKGESGVARTSPRLSKKRSG